MQRNVLEYLEATAPRLPDKVAFSNGTDSLTFGQLSRSARGIGTCTRLDCWLASCAIFCQRSSFLTALLPSRCTTERLVSTGITAATPSSVHF